MCACAYVQVCVCVPVCVRVSVRVHVHVRVHVCEKTNRSDVGSKLDGSRACLITGQAHAQLGSHFIHLACLDVRTYTVYTA